jgi:hypothetical protein
MTLDSAIVESIKRRRLYVVFHFIPVQQLPNVFRRGGLWCARQLRHWRDAFDDDPQKWGCVEKGEALSAYISCAVNPPMGMMTKRKRPVLLELNAPILATAGVAFIGKWSSWGDVDAEECLQQTGVQWFDKMFLNEYSNRAEPHPGEFLVPTHIPLNCLRSLIFYKEEDRKEASAALQGISWPPNIPRVTLTSQVAPSRFGRKMQQEEDEEEP